MLTLGLEQARRGGRGVGDLQEPATVAWQSPPGVKGQTQDPPRSINIRQKITQWEGLSLQGGNQDDKDHSTPPKSKAASRGRDSLSQARSQGLDFREAPRGSGARSVAPGRKWDPPQTSTKPPDSKSSTLCLPPPRDNVAKPALSPGNRVFSPYGGVKGGVASEVKAFATPPAPEDMPPGSFYTSRGFWRRLEGDQLYWERAGRQGSVEALGPPKPQRTFQYQGANGSARHVVQWDDRGDPVSQSRSMSNGIGRPNVLAPPPCNNGFSRHKKNRKSFEYEDVVRLTAQQGAEGREVRRSALSHAFSDDNIYEDVIPVVTRDNPYEDVKLSPVTCLPIRRPRPWASVQRQGPRVPTLPPKPQTLLASWGKVERKTPPTTGSPCPPVLPSPPRPPAPPRHTATQRTPRQPQYVSQIQTVFDAKRGRKRVKSQGGPVREENSGTESDPEDGKAGSRRSVYVQSTLKRRPGYHTLERDLIQLQQQQLFQQFVVVSLRKTSPGNAYCPEITLQFPNKLEKASRHNREAEDRLKAIPKFCFPDSLDWRPAADMNSETFSFVLTGEDGSRWFCYCRKILPSGKGTRLPEVHCIVSRLGCFNLFAKILEEVERRRDVSPALVSPFMRSVMEAPFPAPGRTISVKSFLPGSGNEVLTLCRPVDSRLEHVDFESLLQCLSVSRLLQVFASLLLERRVIFIADKLSVLSRCGHAVLALLYPFTWQHTFVPVLPLSMLDISCSPTPFLMGALAPCLPQLLELPIEEVLIVDLCADRFVVQLGDEDCILPSKLQAALLYLLEERESILGLEEQDAPSGQQGALSSLLSETFVQFFVELVGHYPFHMSDTAVPGVRELQRDSFRKSQPSRGARQFLQLFMDTQMFAGFIHDKELRKGGGKGLFEVRAAEYLESCPDPEPSGVNRLLKGLGKFLQIK